MTYISDSLADRQYTLRSKYAVVSCFTLLSMAGVVLGMVNYTAMVAGKIEAESIPYMAGNLIAAVLVAFSLIDHYNPATAVLQVFYTCVSGYGVWRAMKKTAGL